MKKHVKLITSDIIFEKELNGYNKRQVDSYINVLSDAYQTACMQYSDLRDRYGKLLQEYDLLTRNEKENKHQTTGNPLTIPCMMCFNREENYF